MYWKQARYACSLYIRIAPNKSRLDLKVHSNKDIICSGFVLYILCMREVLFFIQLNCIITWSQSTENYKGPSMNEIISEDDIQPMPSNRRVYPKLSDIRSHLYRATVKHRFSKVDQENVAEKVIHWKASSPEDFFHFRPCGEALSGEGDIRKRISKPLYSSIKLHGSVNSWKDMAMTCVYWMPHTKQPATLYLWFSSWCAQMSSTR